MLSVFALAIISFACIGCSVPVKCQSVIRLDLGNEVSMTLLHVPAGEYLMGYRTDNDIVLTDVERSLKVLYLRDVMPAHTVKISKPFYLGECEVTQAQYRAVMGENPSHFKGNDLPVESVTWDEAMAFCRRMSARTGRHVTLPSEAQWEYACRAGTNTAFSSGNDPSELKKVAWYSELGWGSAGRPIAVKSLQPNAWGFYDMHGNVGEWCRDWYDGRYYEVSPVVDPAGPQTGKKRAVRNVSWANESISCLSAVRGGNPPDRRSYLLGFRVCIQPTREH